MQRARLLALPMPPAPSLPRASSRLSRHKPHSPASPADGTASAAEKAGIVLNSHVRQVNGRTVAIQRDIADALSGVAIGDQVAFVLDLPHRDRDLRKSMRSVTGLTMVVLSSREVPGESSFDGKPYTAYKVQINAGKGVKWEIEKRYSEFRRLKDALIKKMPEAARLLPEFPGMGLFGKVTKKQRAAMIVSRREALEEFIAAAAKNPTIGMDQLFIDFVEMPEEAKGAEAMAHLWHKSADARTSQMVDRKKRVTRAGALMKKGTGKGFGGRHNWTDRWLVLTDFDLEWHASKEACDTKDKAKGCVSLAGATVEEVEDKKYLCAFRVAFDKSRAEAASASEQLLLQITLPDGVSKVADVGPEQTREAEDNRRSWIACINRVVQRSNRIDGKVGR